MKSWIICFLLCVITLSNAQNVTITGFVQDKNSLEPVIGADVFILGTNIYTYTNNYGFFSLTFPEGKVKLVTSFVGYKSDTLALTVLHDTTIRIKLQSITSIQPVVIHAYKDFDKTSQTSEIMLSGKEIKLVPTLGGTSDLIKVLQLMPGVISGNEGSSEMIVRGGGTDQNLVVLDGVPLYYLNHLGGFISVFNPDAINSVILYKGNFPARFGGRLSSVLDVTLRNGDMQRVRGNLTLGVLVSRLTYEFPVVKNKSSVLVSFRTSPIGLALIPVSLLGFNFHSMFYYTFYDANFKWNYIFNKSNRIYVSFYKGDDAFVTNVFPQNSSIKAVSSMKWGNTLLNFKWNHIFSSRIFSDFNISYTYFRYDYLGKVKNLSDKSFYEMNLLSGIKDLRLDYNLNISLANNLRFLLGWNGILHNFIPSSLHYNVIIPDDSLKLDKIIEHQEFDGLENIGYLEINKDFGKFGFNMGLRFDDFYSQKNKINHFVLLPRITLRLGPFNSFAVKFSYGKSSQNVYRVFAQSESEIPVDIWLPAIKPAIANQWTIGVYKTFGNLELSVEGYYKKMSNLTTVFPGTSVNQIFFGSKNYILTGGNGWSYGVEFFIRKKFGKTTGWLSYTYSRSFRQFEEINKGFPYPFHYDRPNNIKIVVNRKIGRNVIFSADWVYGTGYPYTRPIGYIPSGYNNLPEITFTSQLLWGRINSARMDDYHRLDFVFKFIKKTSHGRRIWTIGLYNAYNHLNPYYYDFDKQYNSQLQRYQWVMYKYCLFPILPIISYSITW